MNAEQLAAVVDPVAWCFAMLGALGTVGMALGWAIQCARHQRDGVAWARERRSLRRELDTANERTAMAERRATATDGARSDDAALVRHHAAAAAEGLTEPAPPLLPNGQHDPRQS